MTIAIVRACDADAAAVAAWNDVWRRHGWPFREAMDQRRRLLAYDRLSGRWTHGYP